MYHNQNLLSYNYVENVLSHLFYYTLYISWIHIRGLISLKPSTVKEEGSI